MHQNNMHIQNGSCEQLLKLKYASYHKSNSEHKSDTPIFGVIPTYGSRVSKEIGDKPEIWEFRLVFVYNEILGLTPHMGIGLFTNEFYFLF